jgi:endothelin-converting enzyme/putative endopeptidase
MLLPLLLAATASATARPLTALPYRPGLDLAALDRRVDPCVDFYRFACGGWIAANPIPADQASWSVYDKLHQENQQFLWGVLEDLATREERTPEQRQLGDHFASCMDEAAVERLGAAPLRAELAAIAALRSRAGLAALLGRLHPTVASEDLLFGFASEPDAMDTDVVIATAYAGGLGLPDRDHYLADDERSRGIRARYLAHVERMLGLAGDPPAAARRGAATVLRLETALARASLTRVEKRDPYQVYHRTSVAGLRALTPSFRWDDYLAAVRAPPGPVNVTEPAFFREVERLLRREPLAAWKTYLRFHVALERAPVLSSVFVQEAFSFHHAFLRGVAELPPRWRRCVRWADRDLGEALGKEFVARAFPPERKQETAELVRLVQAAMERRVRALPWMGDATKAEALAKLSSMRNKVGYPERWRDYSALEIRRGDLAGNVARAARFESARQLSKIGKPPARDEWEMTPPTVNAYYDPLLNDMNFPAGVLLPPLYDARLDDAPSYGNTGGTVGHELVHGFDDEGRQFDARGRLRDWWTADDARAFAARAACVADQYAAYDVVPGVKIDSRLTLGEDLADLAGVLLAWDAWREKTRGQQLAPRDGLEPAQRFFVGFAQWACMDEREASKRLNAVTNPHSPGEWRVNGVLVNVPAFREAFSCAVGQPMAPRAEVCAVW